MYASQITGPFAGEDLDACAPCYIKASDGLVFMSNGTAADAAAACDGFSVQAHKKDEPVVLHGVGTRLGYGDGTLTANALLYVGATKGRLADAATTGGLVAVAKVVGKTQDIRIIRDF